MKHGFALSLETENELVFTRGSLLKNMVSFNPLEWKSTICARLSDSTILTTFSINTNYQLVTPKEEKVWSKFIDDYNQSLEVNRAIVEPSRLKNGLNKNAFHYFGLALLGGLMGAIPGSLLTYFTGINSLEAISKIPEHNFHAGKE